MEYCNNIDKLILACALFIPAEIYIGDDLKENVDSGLLSSKAECLVKALLEYR